jgi:hypothetical protein
MISDHQPVQSPGAVGPTEPKSSSPKQPPTSSALSPTKPRTPKTVTWVADLGQMTAVIRPKARHLSGCGCNLVWLRHMCVSTPGPQRATVGGNVTILSDIDTRWKGVVALARDVLPPRVVAPGNPELGYLAQLSRRTQTPASSKRHRRTMPPTCILCHTFVNPYACHFH